MQLFVTRRELSMLGPFNLNEPSTINYLYIATKECVTHIQVTVLPSHEAYYMSGSHKGPEEPQSLCSLRVYMYNTYGAVKYADETSPMRDSFRFYSIASPFRAILSS